MYSLSALKKKLYFVVARYFWFWSKIALKRWAPRVIAVTGSVGKTTMLNLLEVQLGDKAHYSHDANSIFGIAFDIVGLRGITNTKWRWIYLGFAVPIRSLLSPRKNEFYVVEVDGERPREATMIAGYIQPEVTLWVSIGKSHAVYFDHLVAGGDYPTVEQAIAHEFASLAAATSDLVIIDGDNQLMIDALLQRAIERNVQVVKVSATGLRNYSVTPTKSAFITTSGTFSFDNPMPREIATQLLMTEKLMAYLELDIVHDLSAYPLPPSRSTALAGIMNTTLIDSSYNAHLMSMESILSMVSDMKQPGTWVVIADMIEQGKSEIEEHEKLGKLLLDMDVERYILIGKRVSQYTKPVIDAGGKAAQTATFDSPKKALQYLTTELSGGEVILFKGSQYLEWLVEKLLADPSDVSKLARQEPAAVKRRQARGLS